MSLATGKYSNSKQPQRLLGGVEGRLSSGHILPILSLQMASSTRSFPLPPLFWAQATAAVLLTWKLKPPVTPSTFST